MNQFLSELKKGNFVISECPKCKKIVWPPSDFCNKCFESVNWRNSSCLGKLIEFSKKENQYFGIVEIEENFRVIGNLKSILNEPVIGQDVKLKNCRLTQNQDLIFDLELQ